MKKAFVLLILLLICRTAPSQILIAEEKGSLENLISLMEGSFSSLEQSKSDTAYFDIRLHMKRMWKSSTDGVWLYVEQAAGNTLDKPYRQRVYKVTQIDDKTFESAVYTFADPLKYAGDWKKDSPLENLSPKDLVKREGCTVYLTFQGSGTYAGATKGNGCESDLRNAKYASSEVTINSDGMVSWDRGFNENGEQVWGAAKGGYIFKRVNE